MNEFFYKKDKSIIKTLSDADVKICKAILLVKELGRCHPEIFLELTREVLGVFEAEAFGGFGDGGAAQ